MKFGADVHGSQMTHPHFQSFYFPLTIKCVVQKKEGDHDEHTERQDKPIKLVMTRNPVIPPPP